MSEVNIEAVTGAIRKKANLWKWAVGAGIVVLLGPLLWLLASALLGAAAALSAAALVAVLVLCLVGFADVVVMKISNARINAIIAEARKNPIPTLWEGWRQDAMELAEMKQAVEDYGTEVLNVRSKTKALTADLTPEDTAAFETEIGEMQNSLGLMEGDLLDAYAKHKAREVQIKRASAIWDVGMAMQAANARNPNRAEETLAKIKRDTALDAVNAAMNRSKAQLRGRILARTVATGALENNPSPALQAITVDAKVVVPK